MYISLCAALCAWVTPAAAEEPNPPQPEKLSLSEAKTFAFKKNWDILAAQGDVDLATAARIVAREFPNPELSVNTTKIDANGRDPLTPPGGGPWGRSYDTAVAVSQLFEIGGKRGARKASAAAGLKGAEARLKDARRILDLGVSRAYIDTLLASANAEILKQSAESLRKEATIADKRFHAGDISRTDKEQIEIASDRLELDASAAESAALKARIALETLLGRPNPKGEWLPADTLDGLLAETDPIPASGFPPDRPDLLAADAGLKKAEADVKVQLAQRIPNPTFFLQYEHEPPDKPNSVGVGVSIPLPLWNRNKGAIETARVAREQASLQIRKLEAQAAAEVTIARHDYESATQRLRRHRENILPRSADLRKTVATSYEKGGASLLDLLAAQRNDNEVRLAAAQAAAEAATALASLKAALNISQTHSTAP